MKENWIVYYEMNGKRDENRWVVSASDEKEAEKEFAEQFLDFDQQPGDTYHIYDVEPLVGNDPDDWGQCLFKQLCR